MRKMAIYFPILMIDTYILASLFMFKFGVVFWLTPNTNWVVLYILAVFAVFNLGFFVIIKRSNIHDKITDIHIDLFKPTRILLMAGAVIAILYYIIDTVYTYGENTLLFIQYPGAAYDYAEYTQRVLTKQPGFEFPFWYRQITRLYTVSFGLVLAGIPWGLFYFKRLSTLEKAIWFTYLISGILHSWLLAAQSYFFILLFASATFILYKLYDTVKNKNVEIGYGRNIAFQISSVALLFIGTIFIMYIFQHDRAIQRNIRTELYTEMVSKGYEFNNDIYEKNVLQSINIRLKKDIFDINYDTGLSPKEGNATTNYTPEVVNDNNSKPSDVEIYGDTFLEIKDISKYYQIKPEESLLHRISPSLYFAIDSVDMYVTQGYGALSLAFEHDFTWTYFVGNSRFITKLIDDRFGTKIFEDTYIYKNEKVFNWSSTVYWQSIYVWLASDLTFVGVVFLFALLGMLFAKVWFETIRHHNPFALSMLFLMIFGVMMSSANNLLVQDLGLFIASTTVFVMFIISLAFKKRKAKSASGVA